MGELFKLFGTVGVKTDQAEGDLDKLKGKTEETANGLPNGFKKAVTTIGGLFAVGKIVDFGKDAIQASADADAIQSQYKQVFGNLTGDADKMASSMAGKFGMIPQQLQPGMIKFQNLFTGVGVKASDAVKMVGDATTVSADAAAFMNISYDDAQEHLQSFIMGNYEAGDAIGVQANDTIMAQYAISEGVVKTTGDWSKLTEAQKEQVRLNFAQHVQEQTHVTGQAGREAGSYAVVMDKLKAVWEQFLAQVGSTLLPTAINVLKGAIPVVQGMGDKFKQLTQFVKDHKTALLAVGATIATVVGAYKTIQTVTAIINTVKNAINAWQTVTKVMTVVQRGLNLVLNMNPIGLVVTAIGLLVAGLVLAYQRSQTFRNIVNSAFTVVKGVVLGTFNAIKSGLSVLWSGIQSTGRAIGSFFTGLWNGIKSVASGAWNGITSLVSGAMNGIRGVVSSVGSTISGVFNGIAGTARSVWGGITSTISGAMNGARNAVSNGISWIRSLFNFHISWPHIPLPHFSVSGSANPLDWLKGGLPHIGIDWYAKGGIMTGPTPFGMNGDNIMMGGEAGDEAILPLNRDTLGQIGARIANTMQTGYNSGEIVEAIQNMALRIVTAVQQNSRIVIDGQELTRIVEDIMIKGVRT